MKLRLSLLKRGWAYRAILCGLGGGLAILAVGSIAQTSNPPPVHTSDSPPVHTSDSPPVHTSDSPPAHMPPIAPRGNPLVLNDPSNTTPAVNQGVPKSDFQDYRNGQSAGPTNVGMGKALPLFGYDFFRPAREIIDAHREYVKRVQRDRADGTAAHKTIDTSGSSSTRRTNDNSTPDNGSNATGRRSSDSNGTNGADNNSDSNGTNNGNSTGRGNSGRNSTLDNNNNSNDGNNSGNNRRSNGNDNSDNTGGPDTRMDVSDPLTQMINNFASTVPANYQIAPGDVVVFSFWSATTERSTILRTVDPQGTITIEGIAPIVLLGKTVASAENTLKEQLGRFYRNVQVSLTLNKLRTIQVTVSGDAYQPGTYTVPSVASAYNLLFFAGGPTENGSLRNIEILRGGKKVGSLDMYKFELGSAQTTDFQLQAGDMLIVPPRQSRIAVRGEVLRPSILELIEGETLQDALRYAGGIRASGLNQSVRINTLDPGKARIIQDVDVKDVAAAKAQKLYDGDEIEVFSVRALLTNRVSIEGAVDQPNDYPLTPNMRVSDLLNRARGPLNEAYLMRAELRRWNPDTTTTLQVIDLDKALAHDPQNDLVLQKWDHLKVYTRDEIAYLGRRMVTVKGAVQKEGIYPISRNTHVSDLLRATGGPTPDANLDKAFLIHQPDDGAPIKVDVNLGAIMRGDTTKDLEIQDNDQLIVYNIRQTQFTPDHIVQIVGEVGTQGTYPRSQGMKLSELVGMAGGFLPGSGQRVTIGHARHIVDVPNAKKSVAIVELNANHRIPPQDDPVLEDGDVVSVPGLGGYIPAVQKVLIKGAVKTPGYVFITSKNMHLSEAVREAGGLRSEAFPQGAEFFRNPDQLATAGQKQLTTSLGLLNDLLNDSQYQRERAKSRLDIIKATGQAQAANVLVPTAAPPPTTNAAAGVAGTQLANQELVSKARNNVGELSQPDGNIAVNLPLALRRPGTTDDIILLDGDTIDIPETPTTVLILGTVFHKRGVQYRPNETLQQYVDEAGGYAPDSAKDRIEVIRMGGGLTPIKKAGPIQPGDVIVIPSKVLAISIGNHSNAISQFFSSLTSSALIYKFATSVFGL